MRDKMVSYRVMLPLVCAVTLVAARTTSQQDVTSLPYPCPQLCGCQGSSVTCRGGAHPGDIIRQLPNTTTTLRYYFSKALDQDDVSLGHLTALETLELSRQDTDYDKYGLINYITRSDFFQGPQNLTRLEIHLNLYRLHPDVFQFTPNLEFLDLSETYFLGKERMSHVLNGTKHWKVPLKFLLINSFQLPSKVFPDNAINFRHDILMHLDQVPLTTLEIRRNGYFVYEPGLVEFLPSLQVLDARGNMGTDTGKFADCTTLDYMLHPNLRTVSFDGKLDDNSHRTKRSSFLRSLARNRCVSDIMASGINSIFSPVDLMCRAVQCMCAKFTAIPCQYVPPLREVWVPADPDCYMSIRAPMAPNMESFQYSDLATTLSGNTMGIVANTTICVSENNKLRYIDASGNDFGHSLNTDLITIKGLTNLVYLNLQHNSVQLRNVNAFARYYASLQTLLLGGNTVYLESDLDSVFFRDLHQLRSLDLQQCGLSFIPEQQFATLYDLETLNLTGNSLRDVSFNLTALKSLQTLNLSHNEIATLSTPAMHMLASLSRRQPLTLDLTNNPLVCNCTNIDFLNFLGNGSVRVHNPDKVICNHTFSGPTPVSSVDIAALRQRCFPSHTTTIVSSVLSLVALAGIIGISYAIYRRRWSLRLTLFSARSQWRRLVWGRAAAGESGRRYKHDAFIVYNERDRVWVHNTLRPTLEGTHGLKLCIHFRDFIPGHDIEDTIVESINNSRKTLIILSPNFLLGKWTHFEFNMAREKLILDGLDVIVFVLLQDMPLAGMTPKLARQLQKKTYVKWTEDEAGQALFWKQLLMCLKADPAEDPDP